MPNPPTTGLPNPASYTITTLGSIAAVKDNVTGLIWQRNFAAPQGTQAAAQAYCAALAPAGTWRLPTRIELVSLIDFTKSPTIDLTTFPSTPMAYFWTYSPAAGVPGYWYATSFTDGATYETQGSDSLQTRCVH